VSESAIDPVIQAGLDHIDQGITIFDRGLKMVAWNRRFLELLGFPADLAFVGADFASFIRHNAKKGEYGPGLPEEQVAQRVAEASRFETHCFERVRPDGTVIRVSGSPLPQGGFVKVYTDVTAQKEREAAIERRSAERAAALRLSEARLKIIANELPAGIVHVDETNTILYANRRFAKAYGYEPDRMIGLKCTEILAEDAVWTAAPYFEQARQGSSVDFEMTVTLPDGRRKDIRTFLRPEQPARRDVIGFYILSIDITRQKAATAALLQSHKMDALGRLSSGISHDFNNLLTIIIGNLAPLEERLADDVLRTEFLQPALAAARRGSGLTQRLLALARRQPLAPAPVDVETAISGIVNLLRSSMPEAIEVIWSARGGNRPAFADPAQFEMALLNLVINARDAIQRSGEIRIGTDEATIGTVEAEMLKIRSGRYVRVRVADTGVGMSREQRDRIFEPFYSTKSFGVGAGLGLSMVYAFVLQSNGSIRVDSEPGRGTAFTLLLPVSRDDLLPPVSGPTGPPRGKDIDVLPLVLLVDDNANVRAVLRRQLVKLGYSLIEAANADEALDLVEKVQEIDIVVTDIGMPGTKDGLDLALELQTRFPRVGMILMTGHAVEDGAGGRNIPILRKPIDPDDLAGAITLAQEEVATRSDMRTA
jgi:PAS domain S-box-containing protein